MPKEICHWLVASEVLDRLPATAPARRLLADHRHLYLLGAVLPDSPAYMRLGRHATAIARGGRALHDAPDSFLLLQKSLAASGKALSAGEAALLLGVVSHLLVDALFHPIIFYFCGLDRTRHFTFETYLDLHLLDGRSTPFPGRVGQVLKRLESPLPQVAEFCRALFFGQNSWPVADFVSMLRQHALVQAQFSGLAARLLLKGLNLLPGSDLAPYLALFYPRRRHSPDRLFRSLPDYRHPVSGAWHPSNLGLLKEKAAGRLVRLFAELPTAPTACLSLLNALSANANTGQPGQRTRDMRFFAGLPEVMGLIVS